MCFSNASQILELYRQEDIVVFIDFQDPICSIVRSPGPPGRSYCAARGIFKLDDPHRGVPLAFFLITLACEHDPSMVPRLHLFGL
jgi:hypothetical protein